MVKKTPRQIAAIKKANQNKDTSKKLSMLNTGDINSDLVNIEYKLRQKSYSNKEEKMLLEKERERLFKILEDMGEL
tara:strand:- start:2424 stop:2651 length:228 start_codon:yes stop_codon:yes gene_type:complete